MSDGKNIAQNAVWLMLATTAQKAIAFAAFSLIARRVGVAVTGAFFYAVSVSSVFVVLTDLGLTAVVIREVAADHQRGLGALRRALRLKLWLIPLALLATATYASVSQANQTTWTAIALAAVAMCLDALSLLWYGLLRGYRQLRFEAIGMFVSQLLTALIGLSSVYLFHGGVRSLIIALICGSLWSLGWSMHQAKRLPMRLAATPTWTTKAMIAAALPFALAGIFVKVYSYADTLFLSRFHGAVAVGYYAVAYKFTYAFQFLPLTFVAALYPGMSAAHAAKETSALREMLRGSLRLMLVVSAPLAATLTALAPKYIPFIYGQQYRGSVLPLEILAWVLIPIFLDFPIGSLLNATHRAGQKTAAMGIAMTVNVLLNAVLVPRYGPVGAAWSGLISFSLLALVGFWFARHDLAGFSWLAWLIVRGLMVAAIVWSLLSLIVHLMSWLIVGVLSLPLAFALLLIFGLVGKEDAATVRSWLKRKTAAVDAS